MAANQAPSFSPLFDSQFIFGENGELTGRFGLNVLDDLIAGIDEFRAAAASPTSFSYARPGRHGPAPPSMDAGRDWPDAAAWLG